MDSIRIDRCNSGQSIFDDLSQNTRIFIIPKRNSRIRGKRGWRNIIRRFMNNPMTYPREYFKRSDSEEGFSADKKSTGHMIFQRRKERARNQDSARG